MGVLLAVRDRLSRFYGKYDTYIRFVLKFVLALGTFIAIDYSFDPVPVFSNPAILLAVAAACTFLPINSILLVATGFLLMHFYGISLEAALVGGGILLIAMMLYFGIAPSSPVPLLMTALSLGVGVPCAVAVIFGLVSGPLAGIGMVFGSFVYYLLVIIRGIGGNLQATATEPAEAMVQKMTVLIDAILKRKDMLVMMAAVLLTVWVIWLIRRLAIRYAWMVAAVCGCLVYALVRIGGSILTGMPVPLVAVIPDLVLSMIVAFLSQTMLFSLDYKRTQSVQFEDDEYFYFVKAVPKRKIRRAKRGRRTERRR